MSEKPSLEPHNDVYIWQTPGFLPVVGIISATVCSIIGGTIYLTTRHSSPSPEPTQFSTAPLSEATPTINSSQTSTLAPSNEKNCLIIQPRSTSWGTAQSIDNTTTIYDYPAYEVVYPKLIDGVSSDFIIPSQWNVRSSNPNQERLRGHRGNIAGAQVCALDQIPSLTPTPIGQIKGTGRYAAISKGFYLGNASKPIQVFRRG